MNSPSTLVFNGRIRLHSLVLLVLAATMLARLMTATGLPSGVNFLHYVLVVLVFGVVVLTKLQTRISRRMVNLMLVCFLIIIFSALLNAAGAINVILDTLILLEPFLLLSAIIASPWSIKNINKFRFWVLAIVVVHVFMSYFQYWILELSSDDVKGIFLGMGAGHHVGGAVALSAGVYFLFSSPKRSLWFRFTVASVFALVVLYSDAKQVVAVFLVSLAVLTVLKLNKPKEAATYIIIFTASSMLLIWGANTIFPALAVWAKGDLLRIGIEQKLVAFPIIVSNYDSLLNWIFGLGPGHTIGRLGWMLPDYMDYLSQFGATISGATGLVWDAQQSHYISNSITGSSMFSPMFSWAGVWGDLGLSGLAVYSYLWLFVWKKLCHDNMSRFLLITIVVFGGVFSWLEEPGYTLFVVSLIGLRWQEYHYYKYIKLKKTKEGI